MTISNAVTVSRIFMSPLYFVVFFLPRWVGLSDMVALVMLWVLFLLIEASDLADGAIARRLSQTSDTGKLLDPFADSLSRLTYFFCFTTTGLMPIWIFLVLLYRDLGVGFIRLLVLRRGITLSARTSGKLKAWVYAIAGIMGLLKMTVTLTVPDSLFASMVNPVTLVVFYIAGAVAMWSLVDYGMVLFRPSRKDS